MRIGTPKEQPLQASKWISLQALLEPEEIANLFHSIGSFTLYMTGTPVLKGEGILAVDAFLATYKNYIASLKEGILPEITSYQKHFSASMSATPDALFSIPAGTDKEVIRLCKPVVQLQALTIDYSPLDKKFHTMVFGSNNIPWGIQFSYPQLFLDPVTKQPVQTNTMKEYPNTALFQAVQKWMRQNTVPTPFIAEGALQNAPIRLGKGCFSWVNNHPQLPPKGLQVKVTS